MEKIRVASLNFWLGFNFEYSIFVAALKLIYQVEIVERPEEADLVFEGSFVPPRTYRNRIVRKLKQKFGASEIRGKRVYYTGEPNQIPVGTYNGVISYHLNLPDHHFRFPLWVIYCKFWENAHMRYGPDPDADFTIEQITSVRLTNPTKFACTVFGNQQHLRWKAPQWLGRHGEVDIFGASVNRRIHSKMEVLPNYKFNLCFENCIMPGYASEKILQAKMAGCIPLYWGDPAYRVDFNAKSVVNIYEYDCNFERIFDTVDFEEIRQTPLMDKSAVPLNLLADLAKYLEDVMRAPDSSVF